MYSFKMLKKYFRPIILRLFASKRLKLFKIDVAGKSIMYLFRALDEGYIETFFYLNIVGIRYLVAHKISKVFECVERKEN